MMWGRFVILSVLLVTKAAASCNKQDCETGLSVGIGVARVCTTVAAAFCGVTFGLSCGVSLACGVTSHVALVSKEACRACGHGGGGAGVNADRLSTEVKELSITAEKILDLTLKLEGQIQLTQIIALYGADITNYKKVRDTFNRMSKNATGLIIRNLDQGSFEQVAINANYGVAASSMQIFRMMTGGHPLKPESIFQAVPESCQNGVKDYFVKVIMDCYLLESIAREMRGESMNPSRVQEFKKQLIEVEDQFVKDCGCPEHLLKITRQAGLQSALASLARSMPSGHCSSPVNYTNRPIPSFIMDDSTDRRTLKKISLLYSAAPFSAAKSSAAKATAEKYRMEEVMLAQYLATSDSLADLTLYENRLFCAKTRCAIVYEHSDYQGRALEIQEGSTYKEEMSSAGFDDEASSVSVNPGCEVEFWENDGSGRYVTSTGNLPSFLTEFNDKMSSIRCFCNQGSPTTLKLVEVSKMKLIYDDDGSGADDDFSIWRADTESKDYLFSVGDVVVNHHDKPSKGFLVLLAKSQQDSLRLPVDYKFIWNDDGSGAHRSVSIWRPICPAGYKALGDVATDTTDTRNSQKPKSGSIYCVHHKFTSEGSYSNWQYIWRDHGSGCDTDVTFFEATTSSNNLQSVKGFGTVAAHRNLGFKPYFLKK